MPPQERWKTRSIDADWSELRDQARGRGALSNASGRFEREYAEPFDDGWTADEKPETLKTETILEKPKTIITYNTSPDIGFDRTINPYKGCEHGCIYCFARPNHAYRGLSPGLDFETKIFVKPSAPALLRRELSKKTYKPRPIQFAGDTDIYQPLEKELRIARGILEVLSEFNHPVMLITKSALILRDLDLLAPMAEKGLVSVAISFTSLDRQLSRVMEPRCAAPHRRLDAMRELSSAGVPVTAMTAPLIPALNEMHSRIALSFPGVTMPQFRCDDAEGGSLLVHYFSPRPGLAPFVQGVLEGIGAMYGETIEVDQVEHKDRGASHDVFRIRFPAAAE
jgi:DNA repair photolyase